jgi:hypothetical protein
MFEASSLGLLPLLGAAEFLLPAAGSLALQLAST